MSTYLKNFLNQDNQKTKFNYFRIKRLNITWCLVPKVASTSISKLILNEEKNNNSSSKKKIHLFNDDDSKNIQNELYRVYSRPKWDEFQQDNSIR